MSKKSEAVKKWRKSCKERIITAMGGGCCICGYNKCQSALACHHLDPNKKDFALGSIRANAKNWKSIVQELKKCVLVCHNCHCEIHEGLIILPNNLPQFDDKYLNYRSIRKEEDYDLCSICGNSKHKTYRYCSIPCSMKSKWKVDWDSVNLSEEIKTKPVIKIADELGCSDAAVHKRLRKLGLK